MANLNETDQWEEGVYQLEEDDPVLGGPTGIDNKAPRQLANRARYQRLRNVTPWDATFTYPANVAYVSYGGTSWKSVGESLNVTPGTDAAKWVRWGFTTAELGIVLGDAVTAHEAKANPHPQYATDDDLAGHINAANPHPQYATDDDLAGHINAANPHPQYVRHNSPQGLTATQAAQARANIGVEDPGTTVALIQKNAPMYAIDTGAANAAVVAYAPALLALTDGMVLWFKAAAANTGAATLNVNGLGARPIVGTAHSVLQGGEIIANGRCMVFWNATLNAFVLIECTGAAHQVGAATQSNHAIQFGQATGRLLRVSVFSGTSGAYTWTRGPGTRSAVSEIWGGGGGGGGTAATGGGTIAAAGGGGGGGYSLKFIANPGATETVTLGAAGGSPVGNGAGGTGGSTSFGSHHSATGGGGGQGSAAGGQASVLGGAGGIGVGGDVNLSGCDGGTSFAGTASGALGGMSGFGGAPARGSGNVTGNASSGAGKSGSTGGGGGAGAFGYNGAGAQGGGAGSGGYALIWEYA